jgi:phosphoribosylformylglycinamidine (FGAM) synthase-like enzyme
VRSGAVRSAHDIAEGGLAVALAECCVAGEIGARVTPPEGVDPFAEALGRAFIVSGPAEVLDPWPVIGTVGGDVLSLGELLNVAVSALALARETGLSRYV